MVWARVTGAILATQSSAASPWNAGNLGAALANNDRMLASVGISAAGGTPTISAISDGVNTWQKLTTLSHLDNGVISEASLWTALKTGSGTPSSITLTFSGQTGGYGLGIAVGAYSGLSTATDGSEIDLALMVNNTHGEPSDSGTTGGTTTAANELKIGTFHDWGSGTTLTAGTLDTTYSMFVNQSPNGNVQEAIEDADSGSSGSTARSEFNGWAAVTNQWFDGVFVVKLAAGGAAVQPPYNPWLQRAPIQAM